MIGDKVFAGVETNDWKSVSGIVAQETKLNNNFSIISVRFKVNFVNMKYKLYKITLLGIRYKLL